jgi:ketopantoate hydroxymethyltransferase
VAQEFADYIASLDDHRKIGREHRRDGLLVLAEMAVIKYIEDVKNKTFPGEDYSYPIKDGELERIKKSEFWLE